MGEKLTAGGICTRSVTTAERDLPVVQAAARMRDRHVGCLVVVDDTGEGALVVGILTDRDIVTSVVAKEVDPALLVVEDVMVRDVVTALEDDPVDDLLLKMRRKGLRRLPVVTPDGVLFGIVSLDDLLSRLAEPLRNLALAIETEQLRERKVRP